MHSIVPAEEVNLKSSTAVSNLNRTLAESIQQNSTIPDAGYPDRLGPSVNFLQNSTEINCLEITGYWISTVQCYGF
jgi:hypothetical protein